MPIQQGDDLGEPAPPPTPASRGTMIAVGAMSLSDTTASAVSGGTWPEVRSHTMPIVGLKARYLASRRRDEQQAAETYRAFPYRAWLLRTAGLVAVSAVVGAVVLPLLGTSGGAGDAAWFAGMLQLSLRVSWRLLGRTAARKVSDPASG